MQAVIMAGGKGTRLASLTKDEIPKPMVPIMDKPLLEWQIEVLKKNGITDICFIIGHLGHVIKQYFKDGEEYGIHASYIEENEPLGTAGAFFYLKEWLKEECFLLVFGDVFFDIDLIKMEHFHMKNNSEATLFVHPNSHPFDSDLLDMDEKGMIKAFDSKNNTRNYWYHNCVNAGLYILNKSVCDMVEEPVKTDLEKDVLQKMLNQNRRVYGYSSPEYIKDVGTVERIRTTIDDINSGFIQKKSLRNKQKCIFLDRDGTINRYKGLISNEEDFEIEEHVIKAIEVLNHSEWLSIVVTNQPVVARGLCEIEDVEKIHKKMETLLGNAGVYFDGVEYCPHHPDKGYPEENPKYKIPCNCRKPSIGMIQRSAEKYNIDLEKSWIIGDTTVDIQTGVNAGMKTALVLTGEKGQDGKYSVQPNIVGENLLEVVEKILNEEKGEK